MALLAFRIDERGLAEALSSPGARALVKSVADKVAAKAQEREGDWDAPFVSVYRTRRHVGANISVPTFIEARTGNLARAAAAVGLRIQTR
jgi:hypothetical protein